MTTTQPTTDETLWPGYAEALDIAVERAYASPTEYSMPYVENDQLMVPVSQTASAETLAAASADMAVTPTSSGTITDDPDTPSTDPDKSTLPTDTTSSTGGTFTPMKAEVIIEPIVEVVPNTMDQLTSVQDEVLSLGEDQLVGAGNLRTATIDPVNNRVIIKAATVTQEMREALAARYGAYRVALQLVPGMTVPSPKLGRQYDTAPYYGGAYFYTSVGSCSTAFAWTHQGAHYLLTAGHCTSLNGKAYNRNATLGTVTADNWNNTTGSVMVSGHNHYSGDASTIKLTQTSYGRVYKGSSTSTSSRAVTGRMGRRSYVGDTYCVSGQVTGEMCGYRVVSTYVTVRYSDGATLRNAMEGYRYGTCTRGGDSGAPIYNIKSDGTVTARGILSGGTLNTSGHCYDYFTDTYLAEEALPGIIKLGT
ncbi:S1 family peptidase [Micromonospora yasonensis]|uniref:S1 family peptidase n=1 Tax=Micromonospora yasonensis TaxID=1128667 RepID=UPI00222EC272|nr:S1 family peptidase [Micromonospora yasonensis]MCW3838950.1 S1 family peptidase [Micromonospora yasonensis]